MQRNPIPSIAPYTMGFQTCLLPIDLSTLPISLSLLLDVVKEIFFQPVKDMIVLLVLPSYMTFI